jgi:hypothetical protein
MVSGPSFSTWHSIKPASGDRHGAPQHHHGLAQAKEGAARGIERHDLKVKAPSARELQKARNALHNYDEQTLALHAGKPPKEVDKKKAKNS